MSEIIDVAVIGAGPAGLAAASVTAQHGLTVVLLDEQPAAGGQIYRAIGSADAHLQDILGRDYAAGRTLLNILDQPAIDYRAGATVWNLTAQGNISYSLGGSARTLSARHVIVCTGALERPMPFPGWTVPGVMTAGAGQILLKSSELIPPAPTLLAGNGPLLFLVAAQYLRAGHRPAAIVETTPWRNYGAALGALPGALRANSYLRKGWALLGEIKRGRVPHYRAATNLRALGTAHVEALEFRAGGRQRRIPCASLLIHSGVVPNVQISRALDLDHSWDPAQRCWRPRLGAWGETSLETISIAGDGAGIGGAEAALHCGRLAALHAAWRLGAIESHAEITRLAKGERKALAVHHAARPFLDLLYAPSRAFLNPPDETIVCRCEEVSAGAIRGYAKLGCLGPNQTKAFGRPGMGPCQGRYCGLSVAEIIAAARGIPLENVGYYRVRPPIKPVTLGEVSALSG